MYVIAGATGKTGSAVAESLLEQGKPIAVLVRSEEKGWPWRSKGAKTAVASLEDSTALASVLAEAEGAYLLIPPVYGEADPLQGRKEVVNALAAAVRESGIPHVVFLSSVGGHLDSGTGPILSNHQGEVALTAAAKNLTLLRPAYFLENWAPVIEMAKDSGMLPTFLKPGRKIPMIATKDIGRAAAECLIGPANGRRIVELAGPEDYSPEDIAVALASLLGRDIRVQPVPLSAAVPTFRSFGFSESAARLFEEMYAGINSGRVDYERSGAEFRRGTTPPVEVLKALLGHVGSSQAESA